jgi:hypothetical protein
MPEPTDQWTSPAVDMIVSLSGTVSILTSVLRDPRLSVQGGNALFGAFGGKVPLRPGVPKAGEKSFLVARLGLNRGILLDAAAGIANCVKFGSGGSL